MGLPVSNFSGWINEAHITAEIFPGKPVVRPFVSFGDSSKVEN